MSDILVAVCEDCPFLVVRDSAGTCNQLLKRVYGVDGQRHKDCPLNENNIVVKATGRGGVK